ncbi:MAG: diguanylate cyclase [Defluviitaleaceae bacterium]|nr:diguanylate cyclase [Defluviitaleaceae bacterium]MCL2238867.1 diguanylate cyclase [Defluviitaleaceae bacterium]
MDDNRNSILIIDDEEKNIVALSQILEDDYILYVESNGVAGIKTAWEHKPDLILLDVVLPEMNGFEIITALKYNEATRDIPVIFITGLNDTQYEEKGFKLGAADYINKPFSWAVVKLRVRNHMQIVNQMRINSHLSITDELTGIGNRRFFYSRLEQEWLRALRQKTPLGFMMLDIDNFKPYNDRHGHMQGDRALKAVAQALKDSLPRAIDKCARWGGEEFAVILPETNLPGTRTVAERVRANAEKLQLPLDEGTITTLSVSIGIHSAIPQGENYTLKQFVQDTDKALYHAKHNGRNQAVAVEDL